MIISLTGYKQSGKSVVSKYLQEKYGYKPHNFKDALIKELKENFPDLLKEIQETANENPSSRYPFFETTDQLFEEKPPLIRKLMQNYATEVRRKEDSRYWAIEWDINKPDLDIVDVVVDDVRFLNEAQTVKNYGGVIIRIIKTGQVKDDVHSSETEQLGIIPDYTIEAEAGDTQKIYDELDKIINQIK